MCQEKTTVQKIIGTLKISPIKSMGELIRVLNIYQLTKEDFMVQLSETEKKTLAQMDKNGDFGMSTTYTFHSVEVESAHLSDAELLASLDNAGDFGKTDYYISPESKKAKQALVIQPKQSPIKEEVFPEVEQFFPARS